MGSSPQPLAPTCPAQPLLLSPAPAWQPDPGEGPVTCEVALGPGTGEGGERMHSPVCRRGRGGFRSSPVIPRAPKR